MFIKQEEKQTILTSGFKYDVSLLKSTEKHATAFTESVV